MQRIHGAGGGGQASSRRPVEAPDSLQSVATARLMLLVALGETGGPVNGLKSIYLDGTPIENADGSRNFERVQAEWRTGTPTQQPFSGFSEIETETAVGVEIKAGAGLVRHVDNLEANAVRVTVSVSGLFQVDANSNDTNPARVEMAVDLKPANGAWVEQRRIVIQGKCRSKYQRAVRLPLSGKGPWQLRVRRLTPDSGTQNLVNASSWDSFTTIQELQLRYPNYAMLALSFDARQFSRLPEITSDWRLAILQVPSNYLPATGVYDGAWDGRFKPMHSSNPAWWLYTVGTDPRYNLKLPAEGAWKWDLYRIAQWCDQLVSDGQGGQRRRFEMHHYQTDSADAWKVLQDIASVFCGRVIPYAGGVRVMADMPEATTAKQFMPANVQDGRFTYSSTALDERYTVASVSFVDPDDGWKRGTEYVEHPAGLSRYGYQPAKVVAMGCTSRAQAQQYGRYLLETAQNETETVSFTAGLYGCDLLLGELFSIADPVIAGRRMGGRLLAVDGRKIRLDAPVLLEPGIRYSLECPLPDGSLTRRAVATGAGETDQQTLVAAFPATPVTGTTWTLLASNLQPTLWRCVSHREREPGCYEITGIQHFADKWQAIEQGLYLALPPVSQQPDVLQLPPVGPVSLRETVYTTGDQRRAVRLEVDWAALSHPYLRGYVVACRQEGGDWGEQPEQSANHAELEGLAIGNWQVRVVAVSVTGLRSVPVLASIKVQGPTAKPATPQLTATGGAMLVELGWRFAPGVPDLTTVELRYSTRGDDPAPAMLAQLAWPTDRFIHLGIGLGVKYWYWLRVQDSWGNWSDAARASASSVKDPAALLEQLQGSITGAVLADSLRQPIESIGPTGQAVTALSQRVDSVSNDVSASLRKIDQVQSSLNGQTAIVEDISNAVDGVLAERILKVTAGGKVAGIGLRADQHGTALDVLADRFAVSLPDGSGSRQVFTIGQINGRPAVGIAGAVITDGSLVGKRVLAEESVEAGQINTRGLTIKDAAGNVVVDMDGMGAAHIKGQLTAGQIDSRYLTIRDGNGNVIIDAGGLNGAYIKDLTVGTLKISEGAVSWIHRTSLTFPLGSGGSVPRDNYIRASNGIAFYSPAAATILIQASFNIGQSGKNPRVLIDDAVVVSDPDRINNVLVMHSIGPGAHLLRGFNNYGYLIDFIVNIMGVMR